jgi:hypothetical protein
VFGDAIVPRAFFFFRAISGGKSPVFPAVSGGRGENLRPRRAQTVNCFTPKPRQKQEGAGCDPGALGFSLLVKAALRGRERFGSSSFHDPGSLGHSPETVDRAAHRREALA